jgi:sugar lactone lactonase YvrE
LRDAPALAFDVRADAAAPDSGLPDVGASAERPDAGRRLVLLAGTPGGAGNADLRGADARFGEPAAVISDGIGDLYVADYEGDTIRKVVLATGAVTTIAGGPPSSSTDIGDGIGTAAHFFYPTDLALDGTTTLYVAQWAAVRKVDLATDTVTTVAGGWDQGSADGVGPAAGFQDVRGIALDGAAGRLYVADAQNHALRAIDLATQTVTTLVGSPTSAGTADGDATTAQLDAPYGLAYDGAGTIYFAEAFENTIRKVVLGPGGAVAVTTIAGQPGVQGFADGIGTAATFARPEGLALDPHGDLLVGQYYGPPWLRVVTLASGAVTSRAPLSASGGAFYFEQPEGIALDPSAGAGGRLFVADSYHEEIDAFDLATSVTTTVAGRRFALPLESPGGLTSDRAGSLYAANLGGEIDAIDDTSGAITPIAGAEGTMGDVDGVGASARFFWPGWPALDGSGDLFVADWGNDAIRKIVLGTGTVTTAYTGPTAGAKLAAIVPDGAGRFYVAQSWGGGIDVFDPTTGTLTPLRCVQITSPNSLAFDGAGHLYVSSAGTSAGVVGGLTVQRIDLGAIPTRDLPPDAGCPGGIVTTIAGSGLPGSTDAVGTAASFAGPSGLALDGGTLYVADAPNDTVRAIDLASDAVTTVAGVPGAASVVPGPLPGYLNFPTGLAITSRGDLAIGCSGENVVMVVR